MGQVCLRSWKRIRGSLGEVYTVTRIDRYDLRFELRYLKDKIHRMRSAGEEEFRAPRPHRDLMPGGPAHPHARRGPCAQYLGVGPLLP